MTVGNISVNGAAHWNSVLESGSFEEALESLEEVVSQLEAGQLSLADSLDSYEFGILLMRRCEEILAQAELRVRQLTIDQDAAAETIDEAGTSEDDEEPDGTAF